MIFDTISVKARWERWCRWNCDLRVINAFSVVLKASPWRPNHVTICLLRHSGESLQLNGQLKLWRRNWYFAGETHKDTAVSVWAYQAGFLKSTRTSCQLRSKPHAVFMGFAKSHSLKCSLHKWVWCGTARKSARLNCINLIHLRLTAGQLCGSSCIVIPGVVCELLQFVATQ